VEEIAVGLKVKPPICHRCVNQLISNGKLNYVFRSKKPVRAKVVAPRRLVDILTTVKPEPPAWVKRYSFPSKTEAIKQNLEAARNVEQYDQFEAMLWMKHRPLAGAVKSSLEWLGFSVELKEELGDHDLEISNGSYFAIAEVTGSGKHIGIDDLGSLSRYYMKLKYEDKREDIKAILIGNPFNNLDLTERKGKQPFTEAVLKAVKKELSHISLMTTETLYNAIGEAVEGKKSRSEVKELLKSGELRFLAP